MTYAMTDRRLERLLRFSAHDVATILFVGATATVAFDLFGQLVSPLFKSIAAPSLGARFAPMGRAG